MSAMEKPQEASLGITWQEMVHIARKLHQISGDKLDVHELIWTELSRPAPSMGLEPISPKEEVLTKLVRRNTSDKINGIKSACTKLLGITKIASSP